MADYLEYTPDRKRPPLGLFVRTETESSNQSLLRQTRSVDSLGLGSFNIKGVRNPKYEQLEQLINFLSNMPDFGNAGFQESVNQLSELVSAVVISFKDPSLKLLLRSFGWNGKRFITMEKLFEREKLLQSVSNIYLKFQYLNITSIESLVEAEGIKHIEKIAAFVPDLVVEYLKQKPTTLISNTQAPPSFRITGACMLIDISGFSKFSAAMCLKGAEGLDELRKTTGGMLGRLVKVVYEHEGDVIAFAGDALICVFQEFSNGGLDDLLLNGMKSVDPCYRAIYCADILRGFKFFDLSTHIGISQGEMTVAFLGGYNGSWTYLVNGPCISQLSSCIDDAAPHHVVVTQECYVHVRTIAAMDQQHVGKNYPDVEMSKIGSCGNYHFEQIIGNTGISMVSDFVEREQSISKVGSEDSVKSSPVVQPPPTSSPQLRNGAYKSQKSSRLPPRTSLELNQSQHGMIKLGGKRTSVRNLSLNFMSFDLHQPSADSDNETNSQLADSLSTFVPQPVMVALQSESTHQIGELRTVTTLFMSLDTYDPIDHADPATLQPFFLIAQQVLSETGGYLRQFLVDDKGCVLIIMWGMPLHTFSNNSSRALYTAYNIKHRAEGIGHKCSIGITTGSVFCGTIGASERLDYVGIGNEVNLAARFMSKAKHRILVDEATFVTLNEENRPLLEKGEPLTLKGMPQPVCPYIYTAEQSPVLNLLDVRKNSGNKLLKKKVMQELEKQLDKLTTILAHHIVPSDHHHHHHRSRHGKGSGRPHSVQRRSIQDNKSAFAFSHSNFTILHGPAGSGKRTAAEYFLISARERGLQTIQLAPKSHHRNIPYGVMRDLLVQLIGEEKFQNPDAQKEYINTLLDEAFPDDLDNRALANVTINSMLGYSISSPSERNRIKTGTSDIRLSVYGEFNDDDDHFDETEAISSMKRSNHVVREGCDLSFYRLLCVLLRGQPTALVIEDAQFCDELSWNELYLILVGQELDISVLLTMKSRPEAARRSMMGHASSEHNFMSPRFNASSISNTSNWVVPTSEMHTLQELEDATIEAMEKVGLGDYQSGMFPAIFGNANCKIVELKSLTEEEVRTLLLQTLKIDSISAEFLRLVMDASSGNTYWVKNIANLIKDLGVHEIERRIAGSGSSAVKTLIHCRLDLLDADARRIVKLASVVGFEFTPKLLEVLAHQNGRKPPTPTHHNSSGAGNSSSKVPVKTTASSLLASPSVLLDDEDLHTTRNSDVLNNTRNKTNLLLEAGGTAGNSLSRKSETAFLKRPMTQILGELEKSGFVYCVTETPEVVYAFQNELLQKTLYEMIMPSDASVVHLSVAKFLEEEYKDNLRHFYPSLAHHYRQSNDRNKAFKYELKAAALAITSGAFSDGFTFAESAFEFIQTLAQVHVLLEVIDRAETDLKAVTGPGILRTLSSSYASFMFHRESSIMGLSAMNLTQNQGHDTETREEPDTSLENKKIETDEDFEAAALDASKPYAERKIASDQHALRNFQRLRNRVEVLKMHIEEGMGASNNSHYYSNNHNNNNNPETNPDRESLHHGQAALLRSFTSRKLSWQLSFGSRSSSRPLSVERSPVHRQQTIQLPGQADGHPRSSTVTQATSTGCHCVIQ